MKNLLNENLSKVFRHFFMICIAMFTQQSTAQNESNTDPENVFKKSFLYDESAYQYQKFKFPRSSWDNQCTLGEQLKRILGDVVFTDAWVTQTSMNGIEELKFTNIDDILSKDPLFLSFKITGPDKVEKMYFEPNMTFYMSYKDSQGNKQYIAVHTRVRGLMNVSLYTRVSVMLTNSLPTDDLKSFNSDFNPVVFSYLNVYDVNSEMNKRYMDFYKDIETSTLKKLNNNEKLDDYESALYNGINQEENLWYNLGYGEWLYQQNRYYDSYIILKNVYEGLKSNLNNASFNTDNDFYKVCYYRGMAMAKTGHKESAYYPLNLAEYGNTEYKKDFENLILNTTGKDGFKGYNLGYIKMGDVMETLFDINPENIQSAMIADGDEVKTLNSSAEVWNSNMYNLCKNKSVMMTIKYTRAALSNDNNIDRSTLGYENNIVIVVNRIPQNQKKLWRINVMIPNFRNIDFKFNKEEINIPENLSFIVGMDENNNSSSNVKDVKEVFSYANRLYDERRFMEAMMAYKNIFYDSILSEKEYSIAAHGIGYTLQEFGKLEKSVYYLSKINKDNIAHYAEYVSAICSLNHPKAYNMVVDEMERMDKVDDPSIRNSAEYKSYCLFLQRRQAFTLIEKKEYDKARIILNDMLKNPELNSFAKQELEYIDSIEKKQ